MPVVPVLVENYPRLKESLFFLRKETLRAKREDGLLGKLTECSQAHLHSFTFCFFDLLNQLLELMLLYVAPDCFSLDIADAPAKLARAPEVSMPENQPEAGKCCKQFMRRPSFEKLESL
jgi:hypothetical protein